MSTIRVVNLQHTDATEPNIVLESDGTAVFASGITISGGTNLTVSGIAEFASGTVSAPTITFIDDNNTGIYEPAADTVAITTAATERMRIDSSGDVGVGTTNPQAPFVVSNSGAEGIEAGYSSGTSTNFIQSYNRSSSAFIQLDVLGSPLVFKTGSGATERMRIDTSGRLLIGTATARATGGSQNRYLQVEGTSYATAGLSLTCNSTSNAPTFNFGRSRGTSVGSSTIVQDGDDLGFLTWSAADGTDLTSYAAQIHAEIDGTPGSNDTPGRLIFSTTADGNAGVSERMRIDSAGRVGIGTSSMGSLYAGGDDLVVGNGGSSNQGITIYTGTSQQGIIAYADGTSGAAQQYACYLLYDHTTDSFRVATTGQERIRIDSSGNFGIGTTSPGRILHVLKNNEAAAKLGGSTYAIEIGQLTTGSSPGFNATGGSSMLFYMGGTEAMRIDSSRNIGINQSSPTSQSGKVLHISGDSGGQARIHLTTSASGHGANDGAYIIAQGAESGSTAGQLSIQNLENKDIVFGTGTTNTEKLRIQNAGGISFNGDTAAANALDDYEEGTWTPVIKSGSNTITYSGGDQRFYYQKIGNMVTVTFSLNAATTAGTTGGAFTIEGLPFTSANITNLRSIGTHAVYYSSGLRASGWPNFAHVGSFTSIMDVYTKTSSASAYDRANVDNVGSQSYLFWQVTYQTA